MRAVAQNGAPLAALGAITEVSGWDEWGTRIFGMVVAGKPIHVVQGLTEITPIWSKAETLQASGISFLWDMRIATSPCDFISS